MVSFLYGIFPCNFNLIIWKLGCINLQLLAIFSAVSILSPVSIHTLMSNYGKGTGADHVADGLGDIVLQPVQDCGGSDEVQISL